MNMFYKLKAAENLIEQHEKDIRQNSGEIRQLSVNLDLLRLLVHDRYNEFSEFYCPRLRSVIKEEIRKFSDLEITRLEKENEMHKVAIHNIKLKLG